MKHITSKNIRLAVMAASILIAGLVSSCEKRPDNAFGITAPVTSAEQVILDAVDDNPCDNVLSKPAGCQ